MTELETEKHQGKQAAEHRPKVVFILPLVPPSYWGIEYLKPMLTYKSPNPPLGILTLASVITPYCDVEFRDENVAPVEYDTDADIVAISGTYLHEKHLDRVKKISAYFRERGKLVCIGGPVANLTPAQIRPYCDVLFEGEGELTWPKFIEDYKRGEHKDNYVQTEKYDMSEAPIPRIDLINARDYGAGIIQTTRGCPFSCEFCDIIVVFGRKVRMKPIKTVMAEIDQWVAAGQSNIFFCDDNFVGNRIYVKDLLRELIKYNQNKKHPVCFYTQASMDTAKDKELMELLRDANFAGIFVGIESPRKSSLTETLKFQNVHTSDMLEALKKIQSYGLWVAGGMIVGFDNDDIDIFEEQYNFIQEAGVVKAQIGLLWAVETTPLYERIEKDGRLIEDRPGLVCNIKPAMMTYSQLVSGYKKLMQRVYSYDAYCQRYLNSLSYMKDHQFLGDRPEPQPSDLVGLLKLFKHFCLTTELERIRFFFKMVHGTYKTNKRGWKWCIRYLGNYIHIQKYVAIDVMAMDENLVATEVQPAPAPAIQTAEEIAPQQSVAKLEELKAS